MSARDDVISAVNGHRAEGVNREPQAEGHSPVADAPAAGTSVDEVADEPAVAPVKRGPGRPRKQPA